MPEITVHVVVPAILKAKLSAPIDGVLAEAGKDIARNLRLDMQATTRTWRRKPNFVTTSSQLPGGIQIAGGTDDRIWLMLDIGTRQHEVLPKKIGAVLAFRSGYGARTIPNWLGSQPGGAYGATVFARRVLHPGTRPRNWLPELAGKWHGAAPRTVEAYLKAWSEF